MRKTRAATVSETESGKTARTMHTYPRIIAKIEHLGELQRMFLAWKMFDRLSYFTHGFLPKVMDNKIKYFKFLSPAHDVTSLLDYYIEFVGDHCIGAITTNGAMTAAKVMAEDLATFHPEFEKEIDPIHQTAEILANFFG